MLALTQGMMTLSSGSSPAPGTPQMRWRLNITATQTPDQSFAQASEIQMRASVGGANQATGGTASASSFHSSAPPADAFDGSSTTTWASNIGVLGPQWIAYQFTSAVDIVEVTVTSGDNSTRALRAPGTFDIQSSPDGITWTTIWTVTGSTGWGVTETRVFTRP